MISEELNELRQDLKQLKAEILQFERDLAWNRVIDKAIVVCRLLRKLEVAEAVKFNPNWANQPRVPKEQVGGGRWTRPGGGGAAGNLHLTGGRGRGLGGQQPPRGPNGPYRLRPGKVEVPPNMVVPVQTAFQRAETAVARAQSGNPGWRPPPEISHAASTPQQLIAYANRVENRANTEITRQIGNNGGPPLDESRAPQAGRRSFNSDPIRRQVGLPELGGRAALSKSEGTVAAARIDGTIYVGVNSQAPSYSEVDRADANYFRDQLIERYPDVMKTENRGHKPNDFVYHAEATLLLRAWRQNGGSLLGKTFIVKTDREVCQSCRDGLPLLGKQLGNPTVRFISPSGQLLTIRNGLGKRGQK